MNKKLKSAKRKILDVLARPESSVIETATYEPHIASKEKTFSVCESGVDRLIDFSVRSITKNIARYEIVFDYKHKFSRIVLPNAKRHRPGAQIMLDIYQKILEKNDKTL